jgi:hypothetical protein
MPNTIKAVTVEGVLVSLAVCGLTALFASAQTASPRPPTAAAAPAPVVPSEQQGWKPMFDGKSLAGWDGNPDVWKVENGAITAETVDARRVGQTQLIWKGGEPADFDWMLEVKLDANAHSGISYRSSLDLTRTPAPEGRAGQPFPMDVPSSPRWTLYGLNFDFDYDRRSSGSIQELGSSRRVLARRGEVALAETSQRPRLLASLGDADALRDFIKADDWNQLHIVARGHQVTHIANGHVMAVLIDDDQTLFRASGLLGLQIENYETGRVNFRNLWLKTH